MSYVLCDDGRWWEFNDNHKSCISEEMFHEFKNASQYYVFC